MRCSGADLRGNVGPIREALGTLMSLVEVTRSPWQQWVWSSGMRRYRRAKAQLDTAVEAIIAERRAQGADDRGDLLSMLLLACDEDTGGPGMTDAQVRDEVMTIMLAGHETTASALAWTLHLLAAHPEAEAQLHAEIDAVLPDGRTPGLADLGRLPYTRQVFTEAMRLYPPAWILARQAMEPVEIAGWQLPRGALCLVSPYATHHNRGMVPRAGMFFAGTLGRDRRRARPAKARVFSVRRRAAPRARARRSRGWRGRCCSPAWRATGSLLPRRENRCLKSSLP